MRRRLILIVALFVLAAVAMQAQKHEAQSYIRCALARKNIQSVDGQCEDDVRSVDWTRCEFLERSLKSEAALTSAFTHSVAMRQKKNQVAPAIANAVFHATGKRVRDLSHYPGEIAVTNQPI